MGATDELLVRVRHAGGHADLAIEIRPSTTSAELVLAVAEHLGAAPAGLALTNARTGNVLVDVHPVAAADVLCGDELILAPPAAAARTWQPPVVMLDVVAGPDAGRSFALTAGSHVIGRGRDADVVLDDPRVSRRHVVLDVAAGRWTLTPLTELAAPAAYEDTIELGNSVLVLRPAGQAAKRAATDPAGRVSFRRTPYRPPLQPAAGDITCGNVPTKPERRRIQGWAALTPLAAGVVMYAFTRQVQFLALTLIAPLAVLAGAVDDRRSGRRRHAERVAEFERRVGVWRRQILQAVAGEQTARRQAAPDLALLARRAQQRTVDLWARGHDAPDDLHLRLGSGTVPATFRIVLEPGGDAELRRSAMCAVDGLDRIAGVPVVADLRRLRVVGVSGPRRAVDGVVSSLIAQAACLHSPDELVMVSMVAANRPFDWMKWLPHARTGPTAGAESVDDALRAVIRIAESGTDSSRRANRSDNPPTPHLLTLIDAACQPDAGLVKRLVEVAAASQKISVIWIADTAAAITHHASAVLAIEPGDRNGRAVATWWSTDPSTGDVEVTLEPVRPDVAERVAMALAPIVDATAASSSVPRHVSLAEILDVERPTADWVAERWSNGRHHTLPFVIGRDADGVVELDLVDHGPHVLIGGTSGSGKSELLRAMVVSLAVTHPPDRLQFLFVDYKGGAATSGLERLPHSVGCVTNLDGTTARRAVVSLRAELHRRMVLIDGIAKDIDEMRALHPARAPASLVIVIDELATLVKEVPELVDGLIDIAQRGRSLGIHLVLATQRPSGCVSDNILANTNLRIALRVLDPVESNLIVGHAGAAAIATERRGCALVRHGEARPVLFQSGYGGTPCDAGEAEPRVRVTCFDVPRTGWCLQASPASGQRSGSIELLVDAIAGAAALAQYPPSTRPWLPPLPPGITADELPRSRWPHIVFGLLDAPEQQAQHPAHIDMELGGGALVFGCARSGRTTVLRTLARQLAVIGEVEVVAIDAGSRGLAGLDAFPAVSALAFVDDLELVTRLLTRLDTEVTHRRADPARRHPHIVLLIDGWSSLASMLAAEADVPAGETWYERLVRLVVEGRQVGIAAVISDDRPATIPPAVHSAIGHRLMLRQNEPHSSELPPGRGTLDGAALVQVATPGESEPATSASVGQHVVVSRALPEHCDRSSLPPPAIRLHAWLGVADITGDPVGLDLECSDAVVVGEARSGRSCALATIARGLTGHHDVFVIAPRQSTLTTIDGTVVSSGRAGRHGELLLRLVDLDRLGSAERPRVVVIDDLDLLDDRSLSPAWTAVAATEHLRIVAAHRPRSPDAYHPLMSRLRSARHLVFLRPDDPVTFLATTGLRRVLRPGLITPRGRAIVVSDRRQITVQVAI